MDEKNIEAKAWPFPTQKKATSVNYNDLGEVFTSVEGYGDINASSPKPDTVALGVRSKVYSTKDGVSGWGAKAVRGYELDGNIVVDDSDTPEVIDYETAICNGESSWTIAKAHTPQTVRAFVRSVGELVVEPPAEFPPNVAPYPLDNEVSVELAIPAKTSYAVIYNVGAGTGAPAAQTKWYDETLILSNQIPKRTDYTFDGWDTSSVAAKVVYAAGASYTENKAVTLYAVWKARPNTIEYDANGGTAAPDDQTKEYGVDIKLSTAKPIKQGYNFMGWATSKTGNVAYQPGATYNKNADVTLYAVWDMVRYTVTYNANTGANAPAAQKKEYGNTLILSSAKPTKDGHVFQGWSTSASSKEIAYRPNESYTDNANVTLYAVWEIVTYTISYNSNNGIGAPQDQIKQWNKAINLSSTKPTREGHTFKGWATSAGSTTVSYQPGASYAGNADLSLYAVWETIKYTIHYDANGGTGAPSNQTKEYGKTVALSTAKPKRDNHEFLGWSTTANGQTKYGDSIYVDNANLNLYAIWLEKATKIMKNLNGYEIYDEAARNQISTLNELLDGVREIVNEQVTGVLTTGDGVNYVAIVSGIDELKSGVSFTMIPHMTSTTKHPTIKVNNFEKKSIRRSWSNSFGSTSDLPSNDFIRNGRPLRLIYNGDVWVIDNMDITHGEDLIGVVPVKNGGTGSSSAFGALNNLGITWGTSEPPAKGTPNSIYIQIN